MIYYTHSKTIAMQRIQDCATRSKCQLLAQVNGLEFSTTEELTDFIDKWTDRYRLKMTPKQRFDAKKKGQPTFDLLVYLPLSYDDPFTQHLIEMAKDDPAQFKEEDFDILEQGTAYAPIKFYLFCNIDSEKVSTESISSSRLTEMLRKQIDGCEHFGYIHENEVKIDGYEFVRLTQSKSLVDEIEGRTKNKYDWTWRLSKETYGNIQKAGEQLINRFHQITDKTDDEKKAYFEKHLKIFESLSGFRGVRKQIGQMYNTEKRSMKRKYGEKSLQYYRPLKLVYMQRSKNSVPANSDPQAFYEWLASVILGSAKK